MPGIVAQSTSKNDTLESLQKPLEQQLPQLFNASQHSVASHRKNINTLHTLFLRCSHVTTLSNDGQTLRLTGEKAFGDAFRSAVVYPLGVKKGVEPADRIIKFVAGFVAFSVEHDFKQREAAETDEDDDDEDGPASRLVAQLLAFLLKGFQAKNKIARFRCVQLIALMVNSLGEIDDDTYQLLKASLLERVRDKESTVRMQAVVALAKLQEADEVDDEDEQDDEYSVTDVLIDVLCHDPAAEVRRAALFNLIPSPKTLPTLIMRTLDLDPINRRAAFSHVLYEVPCARLTQTQREEAIARGLRDREEGVQRAAKRLVAKWTEEAGGVVSFLELFDLYEGKAAEKILEAIFDSNPALIEAIEFGDDFWQNLTPHTAFIARVYLDHLRRTEDPRLADLEPVVTALAFYIQGNWTKLVVSLDAAEKDELASLEHEFVVGELVGMAVDADYGDEIGRRKVFELMREMLGNPSLPYSVVPKCLDVLLKVTTSEKEFMRIVVEIVQSLRADSHLMTTDEDSHQNGDEDSEEEDGEEDAEARKARRKRRYTASQEPIIFARRKQLDLRCLVVVKTLLERVMGALQENSMLHGLVTELVVPAIKQKDQEVRASGLVCLGLISLLDKSTALDSFELLARQSQDTEGELRVKILQTLFDLLVLHGINLGAERGFGADVILGFLMSSLEQEEPEAEATCVIGVCKLMLSNIVTDEEILSRLILLYFASETIDNQELRQCLSYFFPVYAYSNSINQKRVAKVFLPTLALLKDVYDDLGNSEKNAMVAPLQIGSQLIDWTDPQRSIIPEDSTRGQKLQDEMVHVDLAIQMVQALLQQTQKDERKLLCQLLPKLYIPDESEGKKIKALLMLIKVCKQKRPLGDAVSKNALDRFEKLVIKNCEDRVKEVGDEEWKKSKEYQGVVEFIYTNLEGEGEDEEDEQEDGEEAEDQESEEEEAVAVPIKKAKQKALQADSEDDEEEEEEEDQDDE